MIRGCNHPFVPGASAGIWADAASIKRGHVAKGQTSSSFLDDITVRETRSDIQWGKSPYVPHNGTVERGARRAHSKAKS